MKKLATLGLSLIASPVLAHPGHLTEVAGHSHWIALLATGAAFAFVAFAIVRGLSRRAPGRQQITDRK